MSEDTLRFLRNVDFSDIFRRVRDGQCSAAWHLWDILLHWKRSTKTLYGTPWTNPKTNVTIRSLTPQKSAESFFAGRSVAPKSPPVTFLLLER